MGGGPTPVWTNSSDFCGRRLPKDLLENSNQSFVNKEIVHYHLRSSFVAKIYKKNTHLILTPISMGEEENISDQEEIFFHHCEDPKEGK